MLIKGKAMISKLTWAAGLLLTVFLGSCGSTREIAPPAALSRTEVYIDRWSPDHVWTPGHYEYRNNKKVHVRGRYEKVSRYRTSYAPAHIRYTRRGKMWIDERWK